jgi:hypothetical protein
MAHAVKAMVHAEDRASLQWTRLQSVRNGHRGSVAAIDWVSLEASPSLCRVAFRTIRLA